MRAHWSILVGLIIFAHRSLSPPAACVGLLALVLVHELGHAALVRCFGGRPQVIILHGFGGECSYIGRMTWPEQVMIAWGGVLGQALLCALAVAISNAHLLPRTSFYDELQNVLVLSNIQMMVFNLLPFPPLDGARAWAIVPIVRDKLAKAWRRRRRNPPRSRR